MSTVTAGQSQPARQVKNEDEKKLWRKNETMALLELYKENILDFENNKKY